MHSHFKCSSRASTITNAGPSNRMPFFYSLARQNFYFIFTKSFDDFLMLRVMSLIPVPEQKTRSNGVATCRWIEMSASYAFSVQYTSGEGDGDNGVETQRRRAIPWMITQTEHCGLMPHQYPGIYCWLVDAFTCRYLQFEIHKSITYECFMCVVLRFYPIELSSRIFLQDTSV